MADKVLVNLATGLEDEERVTVAFLVAGAALERGREVAMFLTKDAVRLAVPGHAEGIACDGCPPLERLFGQFAEGGGELLVCPICVNARKLDADGFVANARVAGADPDVGVARRRGDGLQLLTLGHPGRVAVVEHQRVAIGVGEDRHVADGGVDGVAGERDAALLERRARRGHVLDVQRDVVGVGLERADAHALRIDDAQRDGAGLELGEVALGACSTERGRPSVSP